MFVDRSRVCVLASAMDDWLLCRRILKGFLIKFNFACVGVNKLSDLTTCTVKYNHRNVCLLFSSVPCVNINRRCLLPAVYIISQYILM